MVLRHTRSPSTDTPLPATTLSLSAGAAAQKARTSVPWPKLTATQRGELLRRLGDILKDNARRLAEIEVRDNGKLMAEMLAQCSYIPQWFYYFGGLADKIEGSVIPIDKPGVLHYTRREPVGVVAGITPWNSRPEERRVGKE